MIPELCKHGTNSIVVLLAKYMKPENPKEVKRLAFQIIDKIVQNSFLIEITYNSLDFDDLIKGMDLNQDLETSRAAFHICKTFSKQEKIQVEVLQRKKDVIEAIMDILRDKNISLSEKRECLQLIPFVASDPESLSILVSQQVEKFLMFNLYKVAS